MNARTRPERLAHQPEAVAADMIHVRIDGRDRRRHRDHGLDRVAAIGKHLPPGLRRCVMRRRGDAAAMPGGMKFDCHGRSCIALARDLLRKPVSTFRDHALDKPHRSREACAPESCVCFPRSLQSEGWRARRRSQSRMCRVPLRERGRLPARHRGVPPAAEAAVPAPGRACELAPIRAQAVQRAPRTRRKP